MASSSHKLQKLELAHQPLLEPKLNGCKTSLSEYSFANLFLFRNIHDYHLIIEEEELFIRGKSFDGFFYLMPTSLKGLEVLASEKKLLEGIDYLFPIAEEWLSFFEPSRWQAYYKDEENDYLFSMSQMASYGGRHLSKKRNLVKQFLDQYQVWESNFVQSDARQILDIWHVHSVNGDRIPANDAILHFEALKLKGTIYYADAKPAGFIIGEEKKSVDTFFIHFSKADIRYKGIYQYMYQAFAKTLVDRFQYLNMEQDLGKPELRQAKHSYQPTRLCKKMRLTPLL